MKTLTARMTVTEDDMLSLHFPDRYIRTAVHRPITPPRCSVQHSWPPDRPETGKYVYRKQYSTIYCKNTGNRKALTFHDMYIDDFQAPRSEELPAHTNEPLNQPDLKTQKETTMSIHIKKVTFVNGHDLDDLDDDTVFRFISEAEADIKRLQSISKRPQCVNRRIKKLEDSVTNLVSLLDNRDRKDYPQVADEPVPPPQNNPA